MWDGEGEREQGRRLYLEKGNTNFNISESRVTKGGREGGSQNAFIEFLCVPGALWIGSH